MMYLRVAQVWIEGLGALFLDTVLSLMKYPYVYGFEKRKAEETRKMMEWLQDLENETKKN